MPDPVWTGQYDLTKSPEAKGFARWSQGDPVVTLVTAGQAANRRVEIQTDAGNIYIQRAVPSLVRAGFTLEIEAASVGAGAAGIEVALPELAFSLFVREAAIDVLVCDGQGPRSFPTASNAAGCRLRVTFDGTVARAYRNGVLVVQGNAPDLPLPWRYVGFFAEGGGTQAFRAVRWYVGGAVAPG